ncbi:MAG: hypothetical protein EOS18_34125 [Mesorhizobium sp.]|nr:MAG: hypothetical protein EOS18_34125 [Mesorhizobium sp.]
MNIGEIAERFIRAAEIDNQITFAVPSIVSAMTDTLVIDGVELVMKDLRPIPPAGPPVAYIAFVAG